MKADLKKYFAAHSLQHNLFASHVNAVSEGALSCDICRKSSGTVVACLSCLIPVHFECYGAESKEDWYALLCVYVCVCVCACMHVLCFFVGLIFCLLGNVTHVCLALRLLVFFAQVKEDII